MVLLTDFEALEASYKDARIVDMLGRDCPLTYKRVGKAQLKKVAEWGNEPCRGKDHWGTIYDPPKPKRMCLDCWEALLKEVDK